MAAQKKFAVCVHNEGHEASLELRKIYEVLDDAEAAKHQMLRVVDEESEDYLYPEDWFVAIELPQTLEQTLLEISHR